MRRYALLKQVCNLIPPHLANRLANEHGVDKRSRTFTPWSHVVALVYARLTHALGLNDVCDSLRMNNGALTTIRGVTPPSRNDLSHANKVRNAAMAEALYWAMMAHSGPARGLPPAATAPAAVRRRQNNRPPCSIPVANLPYPPFYSTNVGCAHNPNNQPLISRITRM